MKRTSLAQMASLVAGLGIGVPTPETRINSTPKAKNGGGQTGAARIKREARKARNRRRNRKAVKRKKRA